MRYIIVRIDGETAVVNDRSRVRVAEVIQNGYNSPREAERDMEDLIHQGVPRDTLIVRLSPTLDRDPKVGSWLTLHHN